MKIKTLITRARIQKRVRELATAIDRHYRGRELVVVGVLNGSIVFLADLIRHMKTPLRLDSIAASSYGVSVRSRGKVVFDPRLKLALRGEHVLMVDDILDTGRTIHTLTRFLKSLKPASLELCVLLEKKVRKVRPVKPRFVGFRIPDYFVYGYGLDHAEKCRNLPRIVHQTQD